jgi:hypothetical protein
VLELELMLGCGDREQREMTTRAVLGNETLKEKD